MHINLISGLVKSGDQALISVSTILKFSTQVVSDDQCSNLTPPIHCWGQFLVLAQLSRLFRVSLTLLVKLFLKSQFSVSLDPIQYVVDVDCPIGGFQVTDLQTYPFFSELYNQPFQGLQLLKKVILGLVGVYCHFLLQLRISQPFAVLNPPLGYLFRSSTPAFKYP